MKKSIFFGVFLYIQCALAYLVASNDIKRCRKPSDCLVVYERACEMPESINKTKTSEWKKIDEANFAEDKKQFPQGHECKPAPGKVTPVCSNSLCGWKVPN
jgi:hypothetical protein